MNLQFLKKTTPLLGSLLLAVILFWTISHAISLGRQTAEAQVISEAAQNLTVGLGYFYKDQNRFPSPLEFGDENVMLNYFNSFPPPNFASSNCSQNFLYKKISSVSFQLDFCLPVAIKGYKQGWNVINGLPPA